MSRTEETREEKHISIATIVLLDQPMIYDESLRLMSLRIVLNRSLSQGKHRNWVQKFWLVLKVINMKKIGKMNVKVAQFLSSRKRVHSLRQTQRLVLCGANNDGIFMGT